MFIRTFFPCIMCRKRKRPNISILGKNICSECEQDLIQTEVDHPSYVVYKDSIKVIWSGV
ncbi:MAG: sigma factor G inhibitor Gin [Mahellales bacterium]